MVTSFLTGIICAYMHLTLREFGRKMQEQMIFISFMLRI